MIADFTIGWLQSWTELNPASSAALALVLVAGGFVLFPRSLLLISAGMAFGLKSLLIVIPSVLIGQVLSFLLARYTLRSRFQGLISRQPRLRAISAAVDAEGWLVVAIMQLGVPIPAALQNYMFGLTTIPTTVFALVALLFSAPQLVLFVYLGSSGRALLSDHADNLPGTVSIAAGAVLTLILIVMIGRRARAELRRISNSY
jgi:uncharacterized membrane protein YdjX (TVP38/TMEM64 family)